MSRGIFRLILASTLVHFSLPSLSHAGRGGFRGGGFRGGMGMGRPGYGGGARMGYGGRPFGTGAGMGNRYGAYHNGWYHGAWNGNYGGWGGYGIGGYGMGYGLGGYGMGGYGWGGYGSGWPGMYGLGSWAYGPMLYNMGYSTYSNPFDFNSSIASARFVESGASTQGARGTSYYYSEPINTLADPPQQSAIEEAQRTFNQSRAAFMRGEYEQALDLCDKALQKLPNDPAPHEFRALVLFALNRYDEAATALYAVLSTGPGWDWTTMAGLYPSVDVYTSQLRRLEKYARENPRSAAAHFVLAYHYLAQGHDDVAAGQFQKVVDLLPNDALSAKFAKMLAHGATSAQGTQPSNTTPSMTYDISGMWKASPSKDVEIKLTVEKDGPFTWQVTDKGKPRELKGNSTYGNGLLTLDASQGRPIVGKVTWQDEAHFTFQVAGGGPLDPGLNFAR
jgi:tetratricopeptide (TPR) repeat protein